MARMYPPDGPAVPQPGDILPNAEKRLYWAFKAQLPDDYTVVHSVTWHSADERGQAEDGQADFVLLHPTYGILILEVKGTGIRLHPFLRRWYQVGVDGKAKQIGNPFDQAMKSMHVLLRTLRRAPVTVPYARAYHVSYAVWFPDIVWERGKTGWLQGYDDLVLDHRDERAPEAGLARIFAHFARSGPKGQAGGVGPMTEPALQAMLTLLHGSSTPEIEWPVAAADRTAPVPADEGETLCQAFAQEARRIQVLTDEQYARLLQMRRAPRLAIPGAAGTGKTVLALESARRFAKEGLNVLLVCPTAALAHRLRAQLGAERQEGPRLDVADLKALCVRMAEEAGRSTEQLKGVRAETARGQTELARVLGGAVRALRSRGKPLPYDAVLVDDAHDVAIEFFVPLQGLLQDRREGLFYAFYDLRQRTEFENRWRLAIGGALVTAPLTENVRNTRAIFDVMARYQPDIVGGPFRGPAGRAPHWVDPGRWHAEGVSEEGWYDAALANTLTSLIRTERIAPEQIAVITCRAAGKSRWPVTRQHTLGGATLRPLDQGEQHGSVVFTTIRSGKGLEWDVVVLVELDGIVVERSERRKQLLYVATSRARHHLVLVGKPEQLAM